MDRSWKGWFLVVGRFFTLAVKPAKWAWNLIGAGLSGAASVGAWLSNRPLLGAVLILVALALLFLVAGVRSQLALDATYQAQVVVVGPVLSPEMEIRLRRDIADAESRTYKRSDLQYLPLRAKAVRLRIMNDPPGRRREAAVTNAWVQITYYRDGVPVLDQKGRWTEKPQPSETPLDVPLAGMPPETALLDLLPNAEPHDIDIAARVIEGGEGYFALRFDGQWVDLESEDYEVRVAVRGEGMPDLERWFRLSGLSLEEKAP